MPESIQSIFEYHDLIEAIVAALEMRYFHTSNHSERVSNMTERICSLMELPIEERQLYHYHIGAGDRRGKAQGSYKRYRLQADKS